MFRDTENGTLESGALISRTIPVLAKNLMRRLIKEAPGADRRPRSDAANAFAAAHARSAAHLFRHATSTLPFINICTLASCCAQKVRKLAVSADNRPPTFLPRTTSLALLATLSAVLCLVTKPALEVPLPRNALTNGSILLQRLLTVCRQRMEPATNRDLGLSNWFKPFSRTHTQNDGGKWLQCGATIFLLEEKVSRVPVAAPLPTFQLNQFRKRRGTSTRLAPRNSTSQRRQ